MISLLSRGASVMFSRDTQPSLAPLSRMSRWCPLCDVMTALTLAGRTAVTRLSQDSDWPGPAPPHCTLHLTGRGWPHNTPSVLLKLKSTSPPLQNFSFLNKPVSVLCHMSLVIQTDKLHQRRGETEIRKVHLCQFLCFSLLCLVGPLPSPPWPHPRVWPMCSLSGDHHHPLIIIRVTSLADHNKHHSGAFWITNLSAGDCHQAQRRPVACAGNTTSGSV